MSDYITLMGAGRAANPQSDSPINQHSDGTWWFYGETWTDELGPHENEDFAEKALVHYCRGQLGWMDPTPFDMG